MVVVVAVILGNGLMQVFGVTSIFPFFALAANPELARESAMGAWVFEKLPVMDDNTLLVWAGVFSIAVLFLANGISLLSEVVRVRYAHGLGHFLRLHLLESFAKRPYRFFLERNSATLIQKVAVEVTQFIDFVFIGILEVFSRLVMLAMLIVMIFIVDPVIAVSAGLLFGTFYLILFFFFRRRAHLVSEGLSKANQGSMVTAQQFFGGIKPSLVQGKTGYFIEVFSRNSAEQARLMPQIPICGNSPRYLIEPLAYGGLVAVVVFMAARGQSFAEILPSLSVMAFAGYRLLPSVQMLYGQLHQILGKAYTVDLLEEELREAQEAPLIEEGKETVSFQRAISIGEATFQYPEAPKPVFDRLSLTIPRNSSVGIIGTTGSGKSTFVDAILGLHQLKSGAIKIDDSPLSLDNIASWRSMIGYVPQDIFLIDASITENIAYGIPKEEIDHDAVRRAAEAAKVASFIEEELPKKWDAEVGERGVRLSGGQRQRIGLARALYTNPEVLILDEATSALDIKTENEVMSAIRELQGTLTLIIIAHRLNTIEGCDQVVRLGVSE